MEFGGLKILMISTDRNTFVEGSAVSERMKEYGALVDELHIIVMSDSSHGLVPKQLSPNIWAYPTSSMFKFLRPYTAARLGKRIVYDRKFVRGKSIITAQDPFECGLAATKVKTKWRIPLEVQLHTDPFSPYFSGRLNTLRKRIARDVLKEADTLRVVGQHVADEISKRFSLDANSISVLPIYVDAKKMEEARVSFDVHARYNWKFIMLMAARLTEEKNIGQALRVLKRLREYLPEAGLVIVGDGPERGGLENLAKELGVFGHVAFAGWQEDMTSYYKTANLFLQTSRFEGYGLALVEAGLAGLPVVTTPVGIAEGLQNGVEAVICPHDDDEYMFKAIYDLANDSARREAMRMHLKQKLEETLIGKEEYLKRLKENWERTAGKISA